jgi:hypothetical protein
MLKAIALATMVLSANSAWAQWANHPGRGVPRTSDGKPKLSVKPPRKNGRPDLSGIWQAEPDPQGKPSGVEYEINPRYFINIAADRQKPDDLPFQPWAADLFHQRLESQGIDDPLTRCVPPGAPAANTFPAPFKIIQTPELIAILYETETTFRQIFMDGRNHPVDPVPTMYGYSVGKWEGSTLVVESLGFKDRGWLDRMGHPHSERLRLIERFTRRDFGHMDLSITVDDPKTYTEPFTYTQRMRLLPDTELMEYFCSENESDRSHFE